MLRKSHILALAGALVASLARAPAQTIHLQSDWSGGPGEPGPVERWGSQFLSTDDLAWRSISGQLALSGTPLAQPMERIIAPDADHPRGCAVGDFDGDGDMDIVTCTPIHDYPHGWIYWWERQPDDTWVRHVVTDDFYGAYHLNVADMDGDGDTDVLAAAYYGIADPPPPPPTARNGRYAWFENLAGDGSAWTQHLVGEMFWGARYVDAGDLDGDGDMDVVGASELTNGVYEQDGDITWFENSDGHGTSWAQHELETERHSAEAHVVDLDGDGDLDVIGGEQERICWWENRNGDASAWLQRFVTTDLRGSTDLDIGDIDNDGDLDLIGGGRQVLGWWENTAGDGTVWFFHILGYAGTGMVELRDLDGDGDLDAVSTVYGYEWWLDKVSGDGYAWDAWLITHYGGALALGDVDDDGNIDVAIAREEATDPTQEVAWYDLSRFVPAGQLVSSVLESEGGGHWGRIEWEARQPSGTGLDVLVRASNDPNNLGQFMAVPAPGTDLGTLVDPNARYFQYRLDLTSSDDTLSPIVYDIGVERRPIRDVNCNGAVDVDDMNPFHWP